MLLKNCLGYIQQYEFGQHETPGGIHKYMAAKNYWLLRPEIGMQLCRNNALNSKSPVLNLGIK